MENDLCTEVFYSTFTLKVSYEAYKHIPSSYLVCDDDKALLLEVQVRM